MNSTTEKMKIELTKRDLINMVRGTEPSHSIMNHPLIIKAGYFIGGFRDEWRWKDLNKLTEEELYQVYKLCTATSCNCCGLV